jgi:proton-dependent oligopeptide transporter, POT family
VSYRCSSPTSSRSALTSAAFSSPNSNLDPFALIILIPICDIIIYPALRRAGINFSPIKKSESGFAEHRASSDSR